MDRRSFLKRSAFVAVVGCTGCASSRSSICRTTAELEELPSGLSRRVFLDEGDPWLRWREVLDKDRSELRRVTAEMVNAVTALPMGPLVHVISRLAYQHYTKHGRYINESDMFADAGGISRPLMAFLQRQYTWSHAMCTTASVWDPGGREMVMLRSLDWSTPQALSFATRIHRFKRGGAELFASVGITGMTGVLTALKPGAFAVALNYAPMRASARPAADPVLRIRELLEDGNVRTFQGAVENIGSWKLGAPCFISVTGTIEGEGLVFEFAGDRPWPRPMRSGVLVQSNHFDDEGPHEQLNQDTLAARPEKPIRDDDAYCGDLIATSRIRRRVAEQQLTRVGRGEPVDRVAASVWGKPPVLNHETVHFAVLRPGSGTIAVWRSRWGA